MISSLRHIILHRWGGGILILAVLAINWLASLLPIRWDLTADSRYTLSGVSKKMYSNLDSPVEVDVFIAGELPTGFRKLASSVKEFLSSVNSVSHGKVRYRFYEPLKGLDDSTATYLIDSLSRFYGINPYTLDAPTKVGDAKTVKIILPGAIVRYKDKVLGINFLRGTKSYGNTPEQIAMLCNDIESGLEYSIGSVIQKITQEHRPRVGYLLGHGEGWGYNVNDVVTTMMHETELDTVNLRTSPFIDSSLDALIMLKPVEPFSDDDKFKLDQYLMRGGKLFCMVDNMYAEFDSLYQSGGFVAFDRGLNLTDFFFKYGVRINQNLLQDMQCDVLPQLSGNSATGQQTLFVDWPYFPISNATQHPISKNLDGVRLLFPSTVDTVYSPEIRKSILLSSSSNSRILSTPIMINFDFLQSSPDASLFMVKDTSLAVLLEGSFTSFFKNRVTPEQRLRLEKMGYSYKSQSRPDAKLVVVGDGDLATNMINSDGPLPMGFNPFTNYAFANKEFFLNTLEYLVNPNGLLETRSKSYTLRLLNPKKVQAESVFYRFFNLVVPLGVLIFVGLLFTILRKRRYGAA